MLVECFQAARYRQLVGCVGYHTLLSLWCRYTNSRTNTGLCHTTSLPIIPQHSMLMTQHTVMPGMDTVHVLVSKRLLLLQWLCKVYMCIWRLYVCRRMYVKMYVVKNVLISAYEYFVEICYFHFLVSRNCLWRHSVHYINLSVNDLDLDLDNCIWTFCNKRFSSWQKRHWADPRNMT